MPHGEPSLEGQAADSIDDGFNAAQPTEHVTAELRALYSSFQRCLNLRDKYMRLSRQRLQDNPANYDGEYSPEKDTVVTPAMAPEFKRWEIYPPPPSPHWKERDPYAEATETTDEIAEREAKRREFKWDNVVIPSVEEGINIRKGFQMDSNGVYQVFSDRSS